MEKYNRLTVIGSAGLKRGRAMWRVRCDCGAEVVKEASAVRRGKVKSCGCLLKQNHRSHGHAVDGKVSREYVAWRNMKRRCDKPKDRSYPDYGGRGISYDPRWKEFANFDADMGKCPDGHTLERKDNDANYGPTNCRWASRKEQGVNKRNNDWIEFNGERLTRSQWAEKLGLPYHTLLYRLRRGMPLERALQSKTYTNQYDDRD